MHDGEMGGNAELSAMEFERSSLAHLAGWHSRACPGASSSGKGQGDVMISDVPDLDLDLDLDLYQHSSALGRPSRPLSPAPLG